VFVLALCEMEQRQKTTAPAPKSGGFRFIVQQRQISCRKLSVFMILNVFVALAQYLFNERQQRFQIRIYFTLAKNGLNF